MIAQRIEVGVVLDPGFKTTARQVKGSLDLPHRGFTGHVAAAPPLHFTDDVRNKNLKAPEEERGDPEVKGERNEVGDRKCDRTSGDFRVEFQ